MNFPLNKQKVLKGLFVFFFFLLLLYFVWDMSLRVRGAFVFQGYNLAMNELITAVEGEQCQPINIVFGERSVRLINVECLEQVQGEPGAVSPEGQE